MLGAAAAMAVTVAAAQALRGVLAGPTGALASVALVVSATALLYLVADRRQHDPAGEAARGAMVGLNSGLNYLLAGALFGEWLAAPLAAINLAACWQAVSRDPLYQGLLGWSSWLMPMSWPATGVGLLLAAVAGLAHAASGRAGRADWRLRTVRLEAASGTVFIEGGAICALGLGGGFNLGHFSFLKYSRGNVAAHELGHALNVAAFGAIFHYIGAVDQNVAPLRRYQRAYAEILAEGRRSPDSDPLRMWG